MDLKKLYIDERPALKAYLKRINFSVEQVISIETVPVDSTLTRYIFKGLGFTFAVENAAESFKPSLKFNEVFIEGQAG